MIQYLEPFHGFFIFFCADKDAIALMLSSSHSAPELMKLRQSEAFRIFHQHNRSIGHIDSNLDNRGGNQYINGMGGKCFHNICFIRRTHFPVEKPDLNIVRQCSPQLFTVFLHILAVIGFPRFYLGTDTLDLSAF